VVLASAAYHTFLDFEYSLLKYLTIGDLVKATAADSLFTASEQGLMQAKQSLMDECFYLVNSTCTNWLQCQQMGQLPPLLVKCQMAVRIMTDPRTPDRTFVFP